MAPKKPVKPPVAPKRTGPAKIGDNKGPAIDLEADAEAGRQLPGDILEAIKAKGTRVLQIDAALEVIAKKVEELTNEKNLILQKDLPAMMVGKVKNFTLEDGHVIEIEDFVTVRLPPEKDAGARKTAFEYLDKNAPDLVKREIVASFDKGEEKKASALRNVLKKAGYVFTESPSVHWKTLQGWVVEQMQKGAKFPKDLFLTHRVVQASITPPKKSKSKAS